MFLHHVCMHSLSSKHFFSNVQHCIFCVQTNLCWHKESRHDSKIGLSENRRPTNLMVHHGIFPLERLLGAYAYPPFLDTPKYRVYPMFCCLHPGTSLDGYQVGPQLDVISWFVIPIEKKNVKTLIILRGEAPQWCFSVQPMNYSYIPHEP